MIGLRKGLFSPHLKSKDANEVSFDTATGALFVNLPKQVEYGQSEGSIYLRVRFFSPFMFRNAMNIIVLYVFAFLFV